MASNATSVAKPSGDTKGGKSGSTKDATDPVKQSSDVAPAVKLSPTKDKPAVAPAQAQTEQPDPYKLRDLIAQEDMAYWAMLMFIAAVATWIVTSLGTFFIWQQVKLTRKAVEDTGEATTEMRKANELSAHAQRPWLHIENVEVYLSAIEAKGVLQMMAHVKLSIRNSGSGPALDVDRRAGLFPTRGFNTSAHDEFFKSSIASRWWSVGNIAPGGTAVFDLLEACDVVQGGGDVEAHRTMVTLAISFTYRDSGDVRHQTGQAYFVVREVFPGGALMHFPPEELTSIPPEVGDKPYGHLAALYPNSGGMMT